MITCFRSRASTSSGFWFHDNPLGATLPLLLFQMSLIVGCSRAVHLFLGRFGLPEIFSQILAGILLGPYVSGGLPAFQPVLFPQRSWQQLNTVALVGYNLFMFSVGVKTDLGMLRQPGRKGAVVGLLSTVGSMALVLLGGRGLSRLFPDLYAGNLVLNVATAWGLTSFPVLSCVLTELNLLNSKLGRLALSASLVSDISYLVGLSAYTSVLLSSEMQAPMRGLGVIVSFLSLLAFIWLVARPVAEWMIRRTPNGAPLGETQFMAILMIAFTCGLASEAIGHHAATGMFLSGLALPSGPPLGSTLARRLEGFVGNLFLPVFVAVAAFSSDIPELKDLGPLPIYLMLSVLGKMAGVMAPCLWWRMTPRDAFCVALMMNIKGVVEINTLNMWRDKGVVDGPAYALACFFMFVLLGIVTPLLKALYKPHMRYVTGKKRTVQHTVPGTELRVMVCVHGEDDVPPVVTLLQALYPAEYNPLILYVLHLLPLVGRAAPLLCPHRGGEGGGKLSSKGNTTPTDRIANAFRYVQGGGLAQTFVGVAPYACMHNDICALAHDKRASLLILPFHKKMAIDGSMAVANNAFQGIILSVLDYAPCSVGILVDRSQPHSGSSYAATASNTLRRVAMCFLGGPDDREALACVARMSENPAVDVMVIRFCLPSSWRRNGMEEKLDDEAVSDFRFHYVDESRVVYREEEVQDGEGMVGVVRAMSSEFGLFVVGRRHGAESPLTAGLSMWSEHPELGIVGDILASTDFHVSISTLVVQQQTDRVAATGAKGTDHMRHSSYR